ncbi:PREDICTED: alpha-tocopherol transfer protein-like [Rhagoletis zephyria]|uniref:alpha-tocopherol transfer protein-like n=1 Tax=Rhagoletis zephyria TaxID=28612 RepID=UPI0008116D21|nr:PREDICTED: alpha-tocopherol transfer protein-like [Rhagoletis zephyria]XP_017469115.1 PREDICTED: alpha-tocopherol transfer protein-like [Rhagoletis zephyria]
MKPADLNEQYARFPEISRDEMQKFVNWIRAQPHMQNLLEEEALHFFHACKNSMEMSKQVLDTNLTVRTHCDDFFANLDCERPELQRAMRTVSICPLPQTTSDGYRVIIGKLADTNASNFNFVDVMKLYCMIFDLWMYEDGIRPGHIIVIDLKGVTLGHVARIGIFQMKKFLFYLQEAAAIRLIGFHFINIVPFMDKILGLMTPFMKKELTSILYVHSNLEDFFKHVPQSILPKDYGGQEPECIEMRETFHRKLKDSRADMMEFEKRHQVNEKLRPGKAKNASDLFGIQGNFKKLDID